MVHRLYASFDPPATLDHLRNWVEISSKVLAWDVTQGREAILTEREAAQGNYLLDNRDRALDPTYSASPYAPNVVPNRVLWHRIENGATTYDVFKGFVNGWGPQIDSTGRDRRAKVRVTDGNKILQAKAFPAASPDVVDFEDVVTADEPSTYHPMGERAGTKMVHHVRRKRKRHKHETRHHYRKHGFHRWKTRETKHKEEGISGPAGTYHNTPTLGQPGPIAGDAGTSVRFTRANSEYASVTIEQDDLGVVKGVEAMVMLAVTNVTQSIVCSPAKAGHYFDNLGASISADIISWQLDFAQSSGKFRFAIDANGSSHGIADNLEVSGTTTVVANTWYHVFGVWDPSVNHLRIYVNGVLEGDAPVTNSPDQTPAGKIAFGRQQADTVSSPTAYLDGWLAHVAIYEDVLAAERIAAHSDAVGMGFPSRVTGARIQDILGLALPDEHSDVTLSDNETTDNTRDDRSSGDGRPLEPFDFMGDYTTSSYNKWQSKQEAVAGRLTYVADPAGTGRIVGRYEVQNGDIVASGERLEVTHASQRAKQGELWFYGGSFYIPSALFTDTITGTQFLIVNQWKDQADLGPPNLAFRVKNGDWRLQVNSGSSASGGVGATVLEETIVTGYAKDAWIDWAMEVFWSTTSSGYVRIWARTRGGQYTKVYEHTGIPTLLTGGGTASTIYFKEGLYRNISPRTETDVLYHDNYRVGRSLDDILYGKQDPDETTGIFPAATNLAKNGNAITDTSNTGAILGGTIARQVLGVDFFDEDEAVFGTTRFKVTTPGAANSEGYIFRTDTALQGTNGVLAGDQFVVSAFVKRKVNTPANVVVSLRINYTDATNDNTTAISYVLTDYYRRLPTPALIANAAKTIDSVQYRIATTGGAQATEFYVGGVMIEKGVIPTPYIRTNNAVASRGNSRVRLIPGAGITPTQGYVAMLVRKEWAAGDVPATNMYAFRWRVDDNNEIYLRYETGTKQWTLKRTNGGTGTSVRAAASIAQAGHWDYIIVAWTATQIKISLNGAAFVTASDTNIPNLTTATFDVGSSLGSNSYVHGSVKWLTMSSDLITDADAAAIYDKGGPWRVGLSGMKGFTSWKGWSSDVNPWDLQRGVRMLAPARNAGIVPKDMIEDAEAAEGEPGAFFYSNKGIPTFLDFNYKAAYPFVPLRRGFGPNQTKFEDIGLSDSDEFLANDIRATNEDGDKTYTAVDSTSIDDNGHYALSLDSIPHDSGTVVQAYVDGFLAKFKDPKIRIPSLVLNGGDSVQTDAMLDLALGDFVAVEAGDLKQESYIEKRVLKQEEKSDFVMATFSISDR